MNGLGRHFSSNPTNRGVQRWAIAPGLAFPLETSLRIVLVRPVGQDHVDRHRIIFVIFVSLHRNRFILLQRPDPYEPGPTRRVLTPPRVPARSVPSSVSEDSYPLSRGGCAQAAEINQIQRAEVRLIVQCGRRSRCSSGYSLVSALGRTSSRCRAATKPAANSAAADNSTCGAAAVALKPLRSITSSTG